MVDEELSACAVSYLGSFGSRSEERVRAQLGEAGLRRLPEVRAVVALLDHAEPASWRLGDLTEVAHAAYAVLARQRPDLSDAAIRAVVGAYCYAWK